MRLFLKRCCSFYSVPFIPSKNTIEQAVVTGTVEKKIIDEIATVRLDINQLRETANMAWDVCIKEGKSLSQLFTRNQ